MAGPTILLVEDEVLIAQDEMRLLERLGYSVCKHVVRGDQAVAAAEELHPDLVLMDIYLPGDMDGIEAAITIRARWSIPVIFATAYSDDDTLDRAEQARPVGYVLKPFQQKQLQVMLKTALLRPDDRRDTERGDSLALLFDTVDEAAILLEGDVIRRVNDAATALFGVEDPRALLGRPLAAFLTESRGGGLSPDLQVLEHLSRVATGSCARFRGRGRRTDGEILELEIALHRPVGFSPRRSLALIRDVSRQIGLEEENQVVLKILHEINQASGQRSMVRDLTGSLQRWLHMEAVGVRLEENGDFPYYEVRGFPARFVEMENSLCCLDLNGQLLRDEAGSPVLECMCGNVIRGRTDPSLPFFTPHGSFWTNSTSDLLSETTEEDRQARTRNRCNGEGYESVALIPLTAGGRTLGLIQLNDHRRDMFSLPRIEQVERIACDVANAIERFELAEELDALLRTRERLLQQAHHRVNNNLQILMSILNVQIERAAGNAEAIDCIRSTRNRISAIAHTHQALYETEDLSRVDLPGYVQGLIAYLRLSFEDGRESIASRLEVDADAYLPADLAVPFGLVLSEILTNAFRHAFPEGRSGTVQVHGHRRENGLAVSIIDDGIGGIRDWEVPPSRYGSGDGLRLARVLVKEQLEGSFEVTCGPEGTRVDVVIPIR